MIIKKMPNHKIACLLLVVGCWLFIAGSDRALNNQQITYKYYYIDSILLYLRLS